MKNVCIENGNADRKVYLQSLADDYDIEYSTVSALAETVEPGEDFGALITILEDYERRNNDSEEVKSLCGLLP